MKRICAIYHSSCMDEMYLYVDAQEGLSRVPEVLMARFGKPRLVTKLMLDPQRPLARADVAKVLQSLDEQGFYLQMPPPKEDYLLDLHRERESNHDPR